MKVQPPDGILQKLERSGHEAYYVGGCVRDLLLGREIHDWDVTTSASPQQVTELFDHTVPTGIRHGTVTVLLEQTGAEVTTFRQDGAYQDGRHPEQVLFVSSLKEDLARRDFTVNAMAMDLRGKITDLFGGREDLRAGIIRCVGEPEKRFSEDALRMLRAYRFAAQLHFTLEPSTERALLRCAPLCAELSRERIREEMEKTLLSDEPQMLEKMLQAGLLKSCGLSRAVPLDRLAELPAEPKLRWAALRMCLSELDGQALRLPSEICRLLEQIQPACALGADRIGVKRCIAAFGWETAEIAAQLSGAAGTAEEIRLSGECVTLRQLAVGGRDLSWLQGRQVGDMLERLLQHVLIHPQDNERNRLLALARVFAGEK